MDGIRIGTGGHARRGLALTVVVALAVGACMTAASPSPAASSPATSASAPSTSASASPSASGSATGQVELEWFIGLGTGQNPEQVAAENAVVEAFNAANPNIKLAVTIVDNTEAAQTLAARAADPPDILGPVGIRGLQTFGDQLLDLTPYIGGADLSEIEPSLILAFNVNGKQIGLPTGVYSSFIYYNKDLFDEAGLPYPPHEVGAQYEGKPWNWATTRELAMKLTVDADGNDATSPDFDPDNIEQYGLDAQMVENDTRAWSTIFGGSGSAVGDDGTSAQWPDNWRQGLQYWYDGVWTDHFIPAKPAVDAITGSTTDSNTFQFGRTAMAIVHQWYTCCVYPTEGEPAVKDWDIAVLPAGPDGKVTSKLHADTIGIMSSSEHPEEAFQVLSFLSSNADLVQTWGALPAIQSQRDAFFAARDEQFAPLDIDWTVSTKMLEFPDNPSHEGFMPNFEESDAANKSFGSKLWTTEGLDVDSEIDGHVQTLQSLFAEAD